jgi:hypothetical protein
LVGMMERIQELLTKQQPKSSLWRGESGYERSCCHFW